MMSSKHDSDLKMQTENAEQAFANAMRTLPMPAPGNLEESVNSIDLDIDDFGFEASYFLFPLLLIGVFLFVFVPIMLGFTLDALVNPPPSYYEATFEDLGEKYLDDDSAFVLKQGSRLDIVEGFSDEHRDLKLAGEALFTVEKDAHPMEIEVGPTSIFADEAAFNIHQQDDRILLHVFKGEVDFQFHNQGNPKKYTVGEQEVASFSTTQGLRKNKAFSIRHYKHWESQGEFVFVRRSLRDICTLLSRHFDVDVIIEPSLSDLVITDKFSAQDPHTAFEKLGQSAGVTFSSNGYQFKMTAAPLYQNP